MCKYCSPDNEYLDDDEFTDRLISHREAVNDIYEGLELGIIGNDLHVFVVAPFRTESRVIHAVYSKTVKIKYCPMCGRKLNGV